MSTPTRMTTATATTAAAFLLDRLHLNLCSDSSLLELLVPAAGYTAQILRLSIFVRFVAIADLMQSKLIEFVFLGNYWHFAWNAFGSHWSWHSMVGMNDGNRFLGWYKRAIASRSTNEMSFGAVQMQCVLQRNGRKSVPPKPVCSGLALALDGNLCGFH